MCTKSVHCGSHCVTVLTIVVACTDTDPSILFLNDTNRGYPRACINGVWRYVCDAGWTSREAEHVCSQVRFTMGEIGEYSSWYNTLPPLLDSI